MAVMMSTTVSVEEALSDVRLHQWEQNPCTCEAAKGRYSTHLSTCPANGRPVR